MKLPLPRTWWIEPGRVMGGQYPGTNEGTVNEDTLGTLLDFGVRVFVSLQQPGERGRDGQPFPDYEPTLRELASARQGGVEFCRFPIRDNDVPAIPLMEQLVAYVQKQVGNGRLVYVHCWGGHGRTGLGDAKLKVIAAELITKVRQSVTIDWNLRESARAKIKVMVKRILNKYGYPPDLQEEAVKTVLMQAELLCADWV